MSPRPTWAVFVLALALALAGAAAGCAPKDEAISAPFFDTFDRAELGPTWTDTGGGYHINAGRLNVSNAYNHPVWLRKRLPRDAVIELDATSMSPAGDLKIELYGDGK
jgi:hypothetical protein